MHEHHNDERRAGGDCAAHGCAAPAPSLDEVSGKVPVLQRVVPRLLAFAAAVLIAVACAATGAQTPVRTAPSPLPPAGSLGDDCVVDDDCTTGMCDRTVPGGYCTMPCRQQADCGRRGWCDYEPGLDTGYCLQRCEVQRECRSREFQCFDTGDRDRDRDVEIGVCAFDDRELPTEANIGAACRAAIECVAPPTTQPYCVMEKDVFGENTGHPGGMCIAIGCSDDETCGAGARCVRQGGASFCAQSCSDAFDCRSGYRCHPEGRVCSPQ